MCQLWVSALPPPPPVYTLPFLHAAQRLTFTFLSVCVSVCVWASVCENRLTAYPRVKAFFTHFMSDHRVCDRWTLVHSKTCRCNSLVSMSHSSVLSATHRPNSFYKCDNSSCHFWWLIYCTVALPSHSWAGYHIWAVSKDSNNSRKMFGIYSWVLTVVKANKTSIPSSFGTNECLMWSHSTQITVHFISCHITLLRDAELKHTHP